MQYLLYDTETDGVPIDHAPLSRLDGYPRVLSIAWILSDEAGAILSEGYELIQPEPGFVLNPDAQAIHGLTLEQLATGKPAIEVLQRFVEQLRQADVMVAHNLQFDARMVGSELLRAQLDEAFAMLMAKPGICTMGQTVDFCAIENRRGDAYKWPRLSELYETLFAEEIDGYHQAQNDTAALYRCFWELSRRAPESPLLDLTPLSKPWNPPIPRTKPEPQPEPEYDRMISTRAGTLVADFKDKGSSGNRYRLYRNNGGGYRLKINGHDEEAQVTVPYSDKTSIRTDADVATRALMRLLMYQSEDACCTLRPRALCEIYPYLLLDMKQDWERSHAEFRASGRNYWTEPSPYEQSRYGPTQLKARREAARQDSLRETAKLRLWQRKQGFTIEIEDEVKPYLNELEQANT